MHRRDFLDPRRLATSAGHVIAALGNTDFTSPDADITLVRYARPAMGTVFEIVLPFGHDVPTTTIHDALDLIDQLEEQLSIYRVSSEISELNRRAAQESVRVSPELFNLLEFSKSMSQATLGAFDITAGALVHAWGFVRGPKRVPSELELHDALSRTGWQHITMDAASKSLYYDVPVEMNLGSIGKGYALDAVAIFFDKHAPQEPVLIHGGKSSVLAIGKPPGHDRGWSVSIEHPWNPEATLATVYLSDCAIATSAATYKHLVHQGKKLGHILDPRTGWPAQGIASATAIATTAAMADALSTAFYIMGVEETARFCQNHPEVGAILLPDGAQKPVTFNVTLK